MQPLQALEQKREEILGAMAAIGDMRRGSLNEQYFEAEGKGKDGKKRRRGPYYVFTRKVGGKTRSRRVRGPEIEKLQREVSNFHRFQELSRELVEVCEEICRLRSAEESDGGKKNSTGRSWAKRSGKSGN